MQYAQTPSSKYLTITLIPKSPFPLAEVYSLKESYSLAEASTFAIFLN